MKQPLNTGLGVLYRIRLLQSWLSISIICWNVFYLVFAADFNYQLLESYYNPAILSSLALSALALIYLINRKWFIISILMLAGLGLQMALGISCPWLNSIWIVQLLVMLIYPYYFYKYLPFENMLHVMRLAIGVVLIAASWQGQLPVSGNFQWIYADAALVGVLPTGILLTFWKSTRNMAGILLGISMGYIFGVALVNDLWNWIFWTAYISIMLVMLFADNREEDIIAFEWTRSPYYRILILLILAIPFVQSKIIKTTYQAEVKASNEQKIKS